MTPDEQIEHAVKEEREACAKLADAHRRFIVGAAIRARAALKPTPYVAPDKNT